MKKLLTLLSLGALVVSTANAVVVLYSNSYDLAGAGFANGEDVADGTLPDLSEFLAGDVGAAFSTDDMDGTGGSLLFTGSTAFTLTTPNSGNDAVEFSFWLRPIDGAGNLTGARIMFQSTATNSAGGLGINFDFDDATNKLTIYTRVGGSNYTQAGQTLTINSVDTTNGVSLSGSYSYNLATGTGDFSITDGTNTGTITGGALLADVNEASGYRVGNNVVFRVNGGGDYAIDGLTIAVPEPSTYAAILGLGAFGFVMYRRRQK